MLRSLGFMTGMALTAVLTLALTDDVAMDGLRRSAQTLFTGTGPAQPAALAASAGSLSAKRQSTITQLGLPSCAANSSVDINVVYAMHSTLSLAHSRHCVVVIHSSARFVAII